MVAKKVLIYHLQLLIVKIIFLKGINRASNPTQK